MRALIFDLDGTLVDTVYAHVFAWQRAFTDAGLAIDGWRIHRRIGMSGGLFTRAGGARARDGKSTPRWPNRCRSGTASCSGSSCPSGGRCPARSSCCSSCKPRDSYGIATSGGRPGHRSSLDALGVPGDVVVIDRSKVARAKPEPDLFLGLPARSRRESRRVLRHRRCGVGSDGGAARRHAERRPVQRRLRGGRAAASAGAFRVYRDAADLHRSLDELGVLP